VDFDHCALRGYRIAGLRSVDGGVLHSASSYSALTTGVSTTCSAMNHSCKIAFDMTSPFRACAASKDRF
jgi:hypothetical protein